MQKKTKNKIQNFLETFVSYFVALFLMALVCVCGTQLFIAGQLYQIGYHNSDLGHNIRYLNSEHGLNLHDYNNKGKWNTPEQMVSTGTNQQLKALNKVFLWSLALGMVSISIYFITFDYLLKEIKNSRRTENEEKTKNDRTTKRRKTTS